MSHIAGLMVRLSGLSAPGADGGQPSGAEEFRQAAGGKTLELADTTTFDTGVVVLCYKPTRSPQDGAAAGGSH